MFGRWFLHVWLAINQLGNAVLGGDPTMTISARTGYARERGSRFATGMCHMLDWFDTRDGDAPEGDHCTLAMKHYEQR